MYNKVSKVDKQRLWNCFRVGGDYLSLADQLSVARNTARQFVRIIDRRNGVIELSKGGAHNEKIDSEMKEKLHELINENSTLTLEQLKIKLHEALPDKPLVQKSCIVKTLDGMLISMKRLDTCPLERNSDRVSTRGGDPSSCRITKPWH